MATGVGPEFGPVFQPPVFNFPALPPELQMKIAEIHMDDEPAVHHYMIIHQDRNSTDTEEKLTRSYASVDPYHRRLNNDVTTSPYLLPHNDIRHPPLVSLPGFYVNGRGAITKKKCRLPGNPKRPGPGATFANRWSGVAQYIESRPKRVPPYVYIDRNNDVLYFHNEYAAHGARFIPYNLKSPFQFLSDEVNTPSFQRITTADPGGHIHWIHGVRKIAIRVSNVPPAPVMYSMMVNLALNVFIDQFDNLERVYIVLHIQDPNCTLLRDFNNGDIPSQDGFVSLQAYIYEHRWAEAYRTRAHSCNCLLPPIVNPTESLAFKDHEYFRRLNVDIAVAGMLNPMLARAQSYFVVDNT